MQTVIVSNARTPFGKMFGGLSTISATDLGALAIQESVKRAGITGELIDNVLMGMVVSAGVGQIPSRQATVKAGLPLNVPSDTINKVCASSLRAINLADVLIRAGEAEVIVSGGMENMSLCPYLVQKGRTGYRMGHGQLLDSMIIDGLWCPFENVHMGIHGEIAYRKYGISRKKMDEWSLRSHKLALAAIDKGIFNEELIEVSVPRGKDENLVVNADECPRHDTTIKKLEALPPAFSKEGLITAGNAPPVSDGAVALVLMSDRKAAELGINPLATIVAQGADSREPSEITSVPYYAAQKALNKAGLDVQDLSLIEVNEAFAAVALTCIKLGNWNKEMVNVNGGAIALGHPIGASGGRIVMTLIAELKRRNGGYGLATICSGAAQGEALIIKVH